MTWMTPSRTINRIGPDVSASGPVQPGQRWQWLFMTLFSTSVQIGRETGLILLRRTHIMIRFT